MIEPVTKTPRRRLTKLDLLRIHRTGASKADVDALIETIEALEAMYAANLTIAQKTVENMTKRLRGYEQAIIAMTKDAGGEITIDFKSPRKFKAGTKLNVEYLAEGVVKYQLQEHNIEVPGILPNV